MSKDYDYLRANDIARRAYYEELERAIRPRLSVWQWVHIILMSVAIAGMIVGFEWAVFL